jgi:hypothetical protein
VASSAVHILKLDFLNMILQENIDTVTVETVGSVGEEDCIKVKTEEDYIQLVRTVKTEDEVSVVCWCVLW